MDLTVTNVAVATTKFLFCMSNYTVDSDVGTGDVLRVPAILHMCGYAHVRSQISPGMDCILFESN